MPNGLATRLMKRLRDRQADRSDVDPLPRERPEAAGERIDEPLTLAELLAASSWLELGGVPMEFQWRERFTRESARSTHDPGN